MKPIKKLSLVLNPSIPGEELHGMDSDGNLVCRVQLAANHTPKYELLYGTPTVAPDSWHGNEKCLSHIMARAEWANMGHHTSGSC